jgi:hypothetical protein
VSTSTGSTQREKNSEFRFKSGQYLVLGRSFLSRAVAPAKPFQ